MCKVKINRPEVKVLWDTVCVRTIPAQASNANRFVFGGNYAPIYVKKELLAWGGGVVLTLLYVFGKFRYI